MLSLKKIVTQDIELEIEGLERRIDSERRRDQEEIALLRKQMVRVARGEPLSAEAIMGGRLFNDVPPGDLNAFIERTEALVILDVRSPAEWAGGYIPGARHIPIEQLSGRLSELAEVKGQPILAYCAAGGRSAAACDLLSQNGFMALFNAAGGVGAYKGKLEK